MAEQGMPLAALILFLRRRRRSRRQGPEIKEGPIRSPRRERQAQHYIAHGEDVDRIGKGLAEMPLTESLHGIKSNNGDPDGEHGVQEPAGRLAQGTARPRLEHNKEEKHPEKVADPVKQVLQGLNGQDIY